MQELKLGDTVRIDVKTCTRNEVGDIGEVTQLNGKGGVKVTVQGRGDYGNWSSTEHLSLIELEKEGDDLHPIQSLVNKNFKVSSTLKNDVIKFHVKQIEDSQFALLNAIYIQNYVKSLKSKRSGSGITVLITIR